MLRRLKGRVPIEVLTRTGDPIVIPISDTEGKTVGKSGITLSVSGLSRTGANTSFRLTINDNRPDRQASTDPPPALGAYQPPYAIEDHVQLLDDKGQSLWWTTRLRFRAWEAGQAGDRQSRSIRFQARHWHAFSTTAWSGR